MQYRSSLLLICLLMLGSASGGWASIQSPDNPGARVFRVSFSVASPEAAVAGAGATLMAQATVAEATDSAPAGQADDPQAGLSWLWGLIPLALIAAVVWGLSRRSSEDTSSASQLDGDTPDGNTPDDATPQAGEAAELGIVEGDSLGGTTPSVTDVESPGSGNSASVPHRDLPPSTIPPHENGFATSPSSPSRPGQGAGGTSFAGAAGLATGAAASLSSTEDQSVIEASKYNVVGRPTDHDIDLSTVDDGLPELPRGYGESRIVLMPRDPQWVYVYWDIPNEHREDLRRQGGNRLALRLYDVTGIDITQQSSHSMQQQDCDELARSWYLPIPISDRNYLVEIGYLTNEGRWLMLARSNTIHVPPVYPSSWEEDLFATVSWDEDLKGGTLMSLVPPDQRVGEAGHSEMWALAQAAAAQRIAGSLFGSMQHVPGSMAPTQAISSYVFPSGVGIGAVPTLSGLNVSGLTMSGIGFSASAPPIRPRKFWLVADAELIVYGATEPDATVSISGQPIELQPDGTFRFHMSFQDGNIDYPILAVAADGEQARSIHMAFERETPQRRTNTKDEAQEEWPNSGEEGS